MGVLFVGFWPGKVLIPCTHLSVSRIWGAAAVPVILWIFLMDLRRVDDFLKSRFRLIAKLRGGYRDSYILRPYTCIDSPHCQHSPSKWNICYIWWPALTHRLSEDCNLQEGLLLVLSIYEFEQIYNVMYLSLQYHTECFCCIKILCAPPRFFGLLSFFFVVRIK